MNDVVIILAPLAAAGIASGFMRHRGKNVGGEGLLKLLMVRSFYLRDCRLFTGHQHRMSNPPSASRALWITSGRDCVAKMLAITAPLTAALLNPALLTCWASSSSAGRWLIATSRAFHARSDNCSAPSRSPNASALRSVRQACRHSTYSRNGASFSHGRRAPAVFSRIFAGVILRGETVPDEDVRRLLTLQVERSTSVSLLLYRKRRIKNDHM